MKYVLYILIERTVYQLCIVTNFLISPIFLLSDLTALIQMKATWGLE